MKKIWNTAITLLVMFAVIAIAFLIINWKNSSIIKDIPSEEIAKWIGEHSVLYIQTGCIHCEEQENLFGDNVKYLNIIDCLIDTQACIDLGIEGTPTWIINGQKYTGVQTIEKLKELTGYN